MKKILSIALILGATALMACPMGQGMMNGQGMMGGNCQGPMMGKCGCDTSKLPPFFENLGLNDQQKEQVKKLREEGKAFHNRQHEKMMAILTPEQRTKLDALRPMNGKKCNMKGPMSGKMSQPMGQPAMPEKMEDEKMPASGM